MCLASASELEAILDRHDCVTCGAHLRLASPLLCERCAKLSDRVGFDDVAPPRPPKTPPPEHSGQQR